ncbi:hypothetical protein PIB30_027923 [Stylosanthes scabra]|uniref:Uncharacterized protein n=1 Tax=Stylosanthes scabra TaxID=79078 RepID=A0ABU6QAQ3_9FABA|nr:hypothetical protein [Stylosanthes scabra]
MSTEEWTATAGGSAGRHNRADDQRSEVEAMLDATGQETIAIISTYLFGGMTAREEMRNERRWRQEIPMEAWSWHDGRSTTSMSTEEWTATASGSAGRHNRADDQRSEVEAMLDATGQESEKD